MKIQQINDIQGQKSKPAQPAFTAGFELKVIAGELNISPKKMDEFVKFFDAAGTKEDTVKAFVSHTYSKSGNKDYKTLITTIVSCFGGKIETSTNSFTYLTKPINKILGAMSPENILSGLFRAKFMDKATKNNPFL